MIRGRILVVDDQPELLDELCAQLSEIGWEVSGASLGRDALRSFDETSPDVVLLDVMLPDISGLDVLDEIKARSESTPVVVMSGGATIEIAVRAMRSGAESLVQKPFDVDSLDALLEKAGRSSVLRRQVAALQRELAVETPVLPGTSASIRELNEMIHRVASAPSPVLLEGESGTGKGLVAKLLHEVSLRRTAPRVELNCAGLSRELLESELFGHEKGAFTGAFSTKQGLLEIASGGTVFLDEIGELEPTIQARLLKVLEDKSFRRVGGLRDIRVDVRLVAATNRDLEVEVRDGRFRQDLFFRLNVIRLKLPPLRTRVEDIPPIAEHLLGQLSRDLGTRSMKISGRALSKLKSHTWPGNARELRNVLERALLVAKGNEILADDLAFGAGASPRDSAAITETLDESSIRPLDEVASGYVARAVDAVGGNVRKAARLLDVSPSTVYAHLRRRG
ncbi:MAG: sigma-54-dependent Fis family transcriptional regulator [Acidobacteria bacterium]|nr:sigma-54-dependent Fis family transcriptional regulator [Acidobacteriota bacterium]